MTSTTPSKWRPSSGTIGVIALMIGLALSLGRAGAGDRILMEARTLERDGVSLQRVIPSAKVVPSRDLVFACAHQILSSDDVLVFDVGTGECSTIPGNRRASNLSLGKPVRGDGELGDFSTVDACLTANFATLVDATRGLATCFRWFDCNEFSTAIIGPTEVCEGTQIALEAEPGFATYTWEPGGETTPEILVTPWVTTEYVVLVTDEWACNGSGGLTVNVLPAPLPTITGPTQMCSGETVTLDAGSGWASLDWSTGQTTQTIDVSPAASTEYTVTVVDSGGCSGISLGHTLAVDEIWEVEFADQIVDQDTTVRSCSVIRVGPETHVINAAHLTLQAGDTVVLRNGFSIQTGAKLTIRLEAVLNDH
jgi:hypothetical protein